jgi:hypothetical protein
MLRAGQKDRFDLEGWLRLPGLIAPSEVRLLQEETAALIARGHPMRSADPTFQYGPDPRHPGRFSFFRVNDLLVTHDLPRVRLLLGHPGLLAAVRDLVGGAPFAPTTETLLFKLPGHGFGHRWHQDPPHVRRFPSVMVGVYLDASTRDNGAMRLIPRSHLAGYFGTEEWVHGLTGGPFGDRAAAEVAEAEPGDVVFHATSVVHGSPWSDAPGLRRTVYFQFDHYEDVRLQARDYWTRKGYLAGQTRLLGALAARRAEYPEEAAFEPRLVAPEDLP